jgi:hypothetical protein
MVSTALQHVPPPAVQLSSLDKALEPFYGSYHGTRIVIITFSAIMEVSKILSTDADRLRVWHRLLEGLRSLTQKLYRDPESLQVAQILTRANALEVFGEVASNAHAECREIFASHVGSYSEVDCQDGWLIGCAKMGEVDASNQKYASFVLHLDHLATPQPLYECADNEDKSRARFTDSDIFGVAGVLLPSFSFATREEGSRDLGGLMRMLTRVAMDIADVWEYTLRHGHRQVTELPPFKWYEMGLPFARKSFMSLIRDCADELEDTLTHQLRDLLKSVPFVVVWDWLWQKARDLSVTLDPIVTELHSFLYTHVYESLSSLATPVFWNGQAQQHDAIVLQYWRAIDLRTVPWPPSRPLGYPVLVDLEAISTTIAHKMERHWGRRFYGDELPPGFSTDHGLVDEFLAIVQAAHEEDDESVPDELQQDINDGAEVEAYGPPINPLDFADVVSEANKPPEQNCTICAETFQSEANCMKLRDCGHYFHHLCICYWLNGVTANSNLCPECRAQICSDRRPVRAVPTNDAEETGSEDEDTTENNDDGYVAWSDSDLDDMSSDESGIIEEIGHTEVEMERPDNSVEGQSRNEEKEQEHESGEYEEDSRYSSMSPTSRDREFNTNGYPNSEDDEEAVRGGWALFDPDDTETT